MFNYVNTNNNHVITVYPYSTINDLAELGLKLEKVSRSDTLFIKKVGLGLYS